MVALDPNFSVLRLIAAKNSGDLALQTKKHSS